MYFPLVTQEPFFLLPLSSCSLYLSAALEYKHLFVSPTDLHFNASRPQYTFLHHPRSVLPQILLTLIHTGKQSRVQYLNWFLFFPKTRSTHTEQNVTLE